MYISVLFVIGLCYPELANYGVICNHIGPQNRLHIFQETHQHHHHVNKPEPSLTGSNDGSADYSDYLEHPNNRQHRTQRPQHRRHQVRRQHNYDPTPRYTKQQLEPRTARAVYMALEHDSRRLNSSTGSNIGQGSPPYSQHNYQSDQPLLEECCACDEAKYELVFEGLWSRYTHPEDFPENYWLAHFSDIIGASHSSQFRMWSQDSFASEGVKELAETGSTKRLESELKLVSSKTRTIIKARELHYPTLNTKTSAVFRTDRLHHLVSILSKLGPSPDWMVGVSSLELCQSDCTWTPQRVVNLYLWDAGTDSGTSFTSADAPSRPQEKIQPYRKVTQSNVSQPISSTTSRPDFMTSYEAANYQKRELFEPANGPIAPTELTQSQSTNMDVDQPKPYARLTITRQRIYEKSCVENGPITTNRWDPDTPTDPSPWPVTPSTSIYDCTVSDWSDWSTCSTKCGKGLISRTRSFLRESSNVYTCPRVLLIERQTCLSECPDDNTTCVTRDWSEWSKCSVNCGQGFRKRTRSPISGTKRSTCESVELVQKEPCAGSECPEDIPVPSCEVTAWSAWSNCNVACGKGIRLRTRTYMKRESSQNCRVKLWQKQSCSGRQERCPTPGTPATISPLQSGTSTRNPFLPVIDCKLSPWSPWSTCSALCGYGKRIKSRYIIQMPQNGGKPCDNKLTRVQRCKNLPSCPPPDYQFQDRLIPSPRYASDKEKDNQSKRKGAVEKSSPLDWRTTTTTTTQGSSMLDDEDDSKFLRLLHNELNSLQSSSFISNVTF